MTAELMEQIQQWHEDDAHLKIIHTIKAMRHKDRELLGLLARAYNNTECYKEALELLLQIEDGAQEDAVWHYRTGYAYFYLRQYSKAIAHFTRAAALDPGDPDAPQFIMQAKSMKKDLRKF